MMNFSTHKKSNEIWYSPPFYTSTDGYKLQLRVDANGIGKGKGTHVSLFVCLMKGEHDQYLQWPFKGEISIQMLNWREDNQHKEKIIHFNDSADIKYRSKVIEGERGLEWGYHEFIRIADLEYDPKKNCAYLQEDTLCIKIPNITLLTGNMIMLCIPVQITV